MIVYRADTLDITPTRPEHVQFYWRIEQALTGMPIVHTYVLDMAGVKYRDTGVFTGLVKATAPFPVTIDLSEI